MNHQSNPLTRVLFIVPALIVVGLITATASAQLFTLKRTFDDPTVTTEDHFGRSVALDGDRVLIGANWDDTHGEAVGQAHLFDTSGNLLRTFNDPTVTNFDGFGYSVALDGNRMLIGAPFDDTLGSVGGYGDVGQAHLFDASGNLLRTFDNPTPADQERFGNRVALDGNRVLISAPMDGTHGNSAGQAYLFGTSGNLLHTFDDPTSNAYNPYSFFGLHVALDGNRVLISDHLDDTSGTNVGQAHLFDTSGNLLQTFDDPTVTTEDRFGSSVALAGDRVLIGATGDDTHGEDVGQAHLFDTSGNLLRTFDDPTPTDRDLFGNSVALAGNRVLIGAYGDDTHGDHVGQAHLFDTSGTLLQTFDDPTVTDKDNFGRSVALDGNRVLIGAYGDDTSGEDVGQAHIFINCDFNADQLADIEDIDALIMGIAAGTNDANFDLDGDGLVNLADRDEWLAAAGAFNLDSGNPYLVADFDLDGTVDGRDFIIWNANKFSPTGKWSLGDANGDGVTDGEDFIAWNQNKFQPADGILAVPEPTAAMLAIFAVLAIWMVRSQR